MVSFAEIESKAPELQVAAGDGQDSKPEQHEEAPRQLNPGITVPTTNKKKRGKKTAAARGPGALAKNRGNGFEEFFADPPMTPQEALEEKEEIYHPDLMFEERMQNCIQRFRSRRRLQGERGLLFNEYLFLGGVDCFPGSFGGLGRQDLKDLTPAQRREATATDIIYGTTAAGERFYNGDKEAWTVDFTGVAAGFFSMTLPRLSSFDWEKMSKGVSLVENFLKYVLHHDVCPEYTQDIKNALELCEAARIEWPMLQRLLALLPGQFNLAALELFCSNDDAEEKWSFLEWGRPKGFDARAVFYTAFALLEDDELWKKICKNTPKVAREFDCTLMVVSMKRPSEFVAHKVKKVVINGKHPDLVPVGKATMAPTIIEDEWDTPQLPCPLHGETIDLFFDDTLLENMRPGMKMKVTVCELDVGLNFVKTMEVIVPSFHKFLPQELMRHYKAPRENERPAPSIHNPEAEEKQFANAAQEG